MTPGLLDFWAQAVQTSLSAACEVASSVTDHNLLLGDAREVLIREVLASFLPTSLTVGSGQIVDGRGSHSSQIDVVIYDSRFPIFRTLGAQDVFVLEGVLGTIEVKSTLTAKTLADAASNCASVKRLSPSFELSSVTRWCEENRLDPSLSDDAHPNLTNDEARNRLLEHLLPPTYVFGFRGYKRNLHLLRDAMNRWSKDNVAPVRIWPDAIVSQGCIALRNDGRPFHTLDGPRGGYMARVEAAPVKYLLKGLLYRLEKRVGTSVMMDDETQIRMPAVAQFGIDMSGNWQRWDVEIKDVRSGN